MISQGPVGYPRFLDARSCGGSLKLQLWADCWVHHCDGEYHDVIEFSGPPIDEGTNVDACGEAIVSN